MMVCKRENTGENDGKGKRNSKYDLLIASLSMSSGEYERFVEIWEIGRSSRTQAPK
jgi:hypothetical protein